MGSLDNRRSRRKHESCHTSTTAKMQAATLADATAFNCYSKDHFAAWGLPLSGCYKTFALGVICTCAALLLLVEVPFPGFSAVLQRYNLRRWPFGGRLRLRLLLVYLQLKNVELRIQTAYLRFRLRQLQPALRARKEGRQGAAACFCRRLLASRVVRVCMAPVEWVFTCSMRLLCWVGSRVATAAQWCSSRCSQLSVWYQRAQRSRRRTHSRSTAAGSSRGSKRSSLQGADSTAISRSRRSSYGSLQLDAAGSCAAGAERPVSTAGASSNSSSFSNSDSDAEADAESISDLLALLPASKARSAHRRRAAVQNKQRAPIQSDATITTKQHTAAAPSKAIEGCTLRPSKAAAAPRAPTLTGYLAAAAAEARDAVPHRDTPSGTKQVVTAQVKASARTPPSCSTISNDSVTASNSSNGSSDASKMPGAALWACAPCPRSSTTPPLPTYVARLTAQHKDPTPSDATAGSSAVVAAVTTGLAGIPQPPAASQLQCSSKGPATAPATSTAATSATASASLPGFKTSLPATTSTLLTQQAYQPLLFAQLAGTASNAAWGTAKGAASAASNGVVVPAAAADCRTAVVGASAAATGGSAEERVDDDELCVVCWVGKRSVALVHGDDAHLCLCASCSQLYDHEARGCPMCRQPVEMLLPVYS